VSPRSRLQESDVVNIVPTSGPTGEADPALAAVRGLVDAATTPMAVFDVQGARLVANPAFVLQAARYGSGGTAATAERRVPFSPDGMRGWKLASIVEDAGQPRMVDFVDVVADALPIMFNAKDAHSRYLFMNRYQADMYGVALRDAVGRRRRTCSARPMATAPTPSTRKCRAPTAPPRSTRKPMPAWTARCATG
jgi:hypothetical protein